MSRATSRPSTFSLLGIVAACAHPTAVAPQPSPGPVATGSAPTAPTSAAPAATPALVTPPAAQPPAAASGYDQPPRHVLDVLHAPSPPAPYMSTWLRSEEHTSELQSP